MISVGIDVSKGKSTVCIMKPGGEVVKPPFIIFLLLLIYHRTAFLSAVSML